jgi:hypothetical protein
MLPEYLDRVVAFIDILGFGILVKQLKDNEDLHQRLYSALRANHRIKVSSKLEQTVQNELEISVFSDSIAISGDESNHRGVIWTALHLQSDLLAMGVLARGGISVGPTVHQDELLYGEGMLDAYYLESKTAIFPRIVVAQKIVDKLTEGNRALLLKKDIDGVWFLDPFSIGILPSNSESLLEDGYDPHEESLKYLGTRIDEELMRLSDPSHIAKWNWLKSQHEIALCDYRRHGKPRFWYAWEMFEKKHPE